MFAISIPAFLTVDKFGRRTIVISGGLLLMACMLVMGSLYASNSVIRGQGAGRWVVIVLIFVNCLFAKGRGVVRIDECRQRNVRPRYALVDHLANGGSTTCLLRRRRRRPSRRFIETIDLLWGVDQ